MKMTEFCCDQFKKLKDDYNVSYKYGDYYLRFYTGEKGEYGDYYQYYKIKFCPFCRERLIPYQPKNKLDRGIVILDELDNREIFGDDLDILSIPIDDSIIPPFTSGFHNKVIDRSGHRKE